MKEVEININPTGFPAQFASDSEKKTMEYGLQIGQAIQYEWFRKDSNINCRFYNQWNEFYRRRMYARGEQSIAKYKNELAIDGDLSYLNLDWTPVPILPKFVDIVVNGMADRIFKIKAEAQDAMSSEKKDKYQQMIQGQMAAKDMLMVLSESFNINPFSDDPDNLPETDEELALYMQMNYKPAIEIAEEVALTSLMNENHYQDVRKRFDYDLATLGISIGKHQFLPGAGITVEYVDPANVVYSYTEDPHFKDCFYWGEIKTVPITELIKIDPTLTNQDLNEIAKYSQAWYNYYNVAQFYENSLFARDSATLMYFTYKTTNKFVHKKKTSENGAVKVIEKDDSFNPPEEMMEENGFEKIEKTIEVWYEGVMVMGTNIMLKWEMAKNMVRPKSSTQKVSPNYIAVAPRMYKGNIESLVTRMMPFADLIQITHLKLQQVISRMVPDGVFIDADGLNEVDLGTGNAYNPEDALRLYFQTGSVIGRSYTQEGEFNNARVPIQQLTGSTGQSKMQALIFNYNHYLDMIRAVTGLNEARDGSTPDPRSLVGVQKLAALNSNTATRHILDASLYIYRSIAEGLSCRIADVLEYADFKEEFANKIGQYNVAILDDIKDLYLYDFGIYIEVSPDAEEKAQREANIQMALSKNDISLEDAIDIREINNIKLSNQLLKLKRKQKQEQEQKQKMLEQQMQAQLQLQSQQVAAQSAMQKIEMEAQRDIQVKQAETAFSIEKLTAEADLKKSLMAEEFKYNRILKDTEESSIQNRESQREKAKADRISQANTEQSRLINQRKNNLPPQRFESNEDTLDGFDLAQFEPR
tara:strand:+ start:3381 stop:5819 length:2439 start_codon:yes stop_codon:yes gene_type:complete